MNAKYEIRVTLIFLLLRINSLKIAFLLNVDSVLFQFFVCLSVLLPLLVLLLLFI